MQIFVDILKRKTLYYQLISVQKSSVSEFQNKNIYSERNRSVLVREAVQANSVYEASLIASTLTPPFSKSVGFVFFLTGSRLHVRLQIHDLDTKESLKTRSATSVSGFAQVLRLLKQFFQDESTS